MRAKACITVLVTITVMWVAALQAEDLEQAVFELSIPAMDAGPAIQGLARQTGYSVLFESADVAGIRVNAVKGDYVLTDALRVLFAGTGLSAELTRRGVLVITHKPISRENKLMTDKSKNLLWGRLLAALAAASTAHPAVSADGSSSRQNLIEEVVVTATKRQELLSDVAETINVVSSERLGQFNVFQFEDVQALTPGLSMQRPDARTQAISLRGVPYDPDSTTASTVVTYWNGMVARSNVVFTQLFDIKQIEVLRGPQGTLQGQTSPSGAIQIVTRDANSDVVEGNFRQSFDDNKTSTTEAALNVPLIEGELGMRIAGVYNDGEMYGLKSIGNNRKATTLTRAGRVNFYYTPTDAFDASLTYEYLERFTDGLESVEGSDALGNGHPTLNAYDRVSLQEGSSDIHGRHELISLAANWMLEDHTLSLVSGYQNNLDFALRDRDVANILKGQDQDQYVANNYEIWSHELRLANNNSDFWEYIVGLYYYDSHNFTLNKNTSLSSFVYDGSTAPSLAPGRRPSLTTSKIPRDDTSYAVFTDHKFYLTDSTRLQFGLRWQKNKGFQKLDTYALDVQGVPTGTFLTSSIPKEHQSTDGNAVTGSVKLAHDLNDGWTIYTSYGRSNRAAGSAISPTSGVDGSLLLYDEEDSDSIEVGFKSNLAGGRYRLNGAVYYQKFDGFQNRRKGIFLDLNDDGYLDTSISGGLNYNADAIVQGAELELNALFTPDWQSYVAVSYNDSKFDNASLLCGTLGDLADQGKQTRSCTSSGRLGPEPNWSFTASSEYIFPGLLGGDIDAFVRGLYKFNGSRHDDFGSVNPGLYDEYSLGGFGTWDLHLGLSAPNGLWELSLWGKNIFDKEAKTRLDAQQVNSGSNYISGSKVSEVLASGYSRVSLINERTIGVTAQYRF